MIYPSTVDAHSAAVKLPGMNFNMLPGLRRPTDFSVSSILGTNVSPSTESSPVRPGAWSNAGNSTPGTRFPVNRDILAAEVLMSQQQQVAAMRGMDGSAVDPADSTDDAAVELEGMDLWEQFHDIGTEMVITKCGRYAHLIVTHKNKNKICVIELIPIIRGLILLGYRTANSLLIRIKCSCTFSCLSFYLLEARYFIFLMYFLCEIDSLLSDNFNKVVVYIVSSGDTE